MQRRTTKKLIILSLFIFASSLVAVAQVSTHRLVRADSLFKTKRYVQAMEQYREIFAQHEYTPAMLLKMAFIQEGLQQTGEALYFLNLYYDATNDKTVVEKMEELAARKKLEGYEQTDMSRFLIFYNDYYWPIGWLLTASALLLLGVSFYTKRTQRMVWPSLGGMVIALALLIVHNTVGGKISRGIIASGNTYLMDGPSPGASVVSIVEGGHRVEVIGKKDVWVKIKWRGETVFVKETNLLPMNL
jgi:hypothetical protein